MRILAVFEDAGARAFEVLTCVRAAFDLRCGARTLLDRIVDRVKHDKLVLLPHAERAALIAEMHPDAQVGADAKENPWDANDEVVFVNGRLLALGNDVETLVTRARAACTQGTASGGASGTVAVGSSVVVAYATGAAAASFAGALAANATPAIEPPAPGVQSVQTLSLIATDGSVLLEHVWDLAQHNRAALVDDFTRGPGAGVSVGARIDPGVHLLEDGNIRIEEGVRLRPGVVLDAENGPITLAAHVDVEPGVVVRGPAWIGPRCLLKAGAKIHADTSIGPVCKVGGEIAASILQAYSNKQHDGYLGHAFVAEWVNLGADTNNSDLKNNYGNVRMWEAGEYVDTRSMFVGLVAADHVKSAINTQFNTGTVVGLSSQVFGAGFPPKYIAPFAWGTGGETYAFERALATARTVMARRQRELSPAYEAAFRRAFDAARATPRGAANA